MVIWSPYNPNIVQACANHITDLGKPTHLIQPNVHVKVIDHSTSEYTTLKSPNPV